jgi:hypothetical protein
MPSVVVLPIICHLPAATLPIAIESLPVADCFYIKKRPIAMADCHKVLHIIMADCHLNYNDGRLRHLKRATQMKNKTQK